VIHEQSFKWHEEPISSHAGTVLQPTTDAEMLDRRGMHIEGVTERLDASGTAHMALKRTIMNQGRATRSPFRPPAMGKTRVLLLQEAA
jgi:hypothetical protein